MRQVFRYGSSFSEDEEGLTVFFKFGDADLVCTNHLGSNGCRIVAVFEQDNFWRGTESIRKRNEVCIRSENEKAILSSVIPDFAIGVDLLRPACITSTEPGKKS